MIGQAITEYEEDTGTTITKIAFYKDGAFTYSQYPDVFNWGDMCMSAFLTSWSDIRAVNYYLNANYERIEQNPDYTKYFAGQNWNQFSKEQVIFDGDTLHYCVY